MRSEPSSEPRPEDTAARALAVSSELDGPAREIQEKVNEYRFLVAPVEQAIAEMERVRRMLQARTEDDIQTLSPALAALSEALGVTTLELLMAPNRADFLRDAMSRSGMTPDALAHQVMETGTGAREQWLALGLPSAGYTLEEAQ